MNMHQNARLTPKGREVLIRRLERGEHPRTRTRCEFSQLGPVKGKHSAEDLQSSLRAGLEYQRKGRAQSPDVGLPYSEFVLHGAGFPVTVKGEGVIAAIGISGSPSVQDHELSTATLAAHMSIARPALPHGS